METQLNRRRARWAEAANPQAFVGGPVTVEIPPSPNEVYVVVRCPECGEGFKNRQGMLVHYKRKHR